MFRGVFGFALEVQPHISHLEQQHPFLKVSYFATSMNENSEVLRDGLYKLLQENVIDSLL